MSLELKANDPSKLPVLKALKNQINIFQINPKIILFISINAHENLEYYQHQYLHYQGKIIHASI